MTQDGFVAVTTARETAKLSLTDGFPAPLCPLALASYVPVTPRRFLSWHDRPALPPPDLVITLQHLVI
ncbi:MAG TPA: hypothetical protein DDY78_16815 [Planctomycetales bacterium]|nr:hypothetical protein [Planctomycetales bacterium]